MGAVRTWADLFPEDPPPRLRPFDPGGEGLYFVYLTNRNECSCLHLPRPVDRAYLDLLDAHFPMGYSTLFVLEKLSIERPEPRLLVPPERQFCLFADPEATSLGSGATLSTHVSHEDAVAELQREALAGRRCLITRIIECSSWH